MAYLLAAFRSETLRDTASLDNWLAEFRASGGDRCAVGHAEARVFLARLRELAARTERGTPLTLPRLPR